jgi:chorismate mutase
VDLTTRTVAGWAGVEGRPLYIVGPCSAESPEQLREAARRLKGQRADYLRAGVWKPRTRPGSFEGIGEPALAWLRETGREYGMRTATEVASPDHVEAALAQGIDLLWIGARTTVSPFAVQELAAALRGTRVPVLVKNPTSPDLGLWIGALERLHAVGLDALGVIHRGFMTGGLSRYRNPPMWEIAIEFRRRFPHVPMLTDPSHISGRRDLVPEVAQAALNLGLDGLMIEAHPDPDRAWSDATQQVTPERYGEIVSRLVVRHPTSPRADFAIEIETLRHQIDHLDRELLELLSQRMRVVDDIAAAKQAHNVATLQVTRWQELLADRLQRATELGLEPAYARALFEMIHTESVRRQGAQLGDAAPTTATP